MSVSLRTDHITKRFGGLNAVDDVTLTVEAGSITGLIGPNGAGKSTMFNLVTRVLDPTDGQIFIGDVDSTALSSAQVAGLGVARTFQTPRGFRSLSVLDNVEVMLPAPRDNLLQALLKPAVHDTSRRERAMEALATVGLAERAKEPFGNLSGGEQRLLEIARQLVREPRALLLDEPTAGVHPALQERLRGLLRASNAAGVTVLLVEHNLSFLMAVASYVHVMASGRLLASGKPKEISNDPVLIEAYLGRGTAACS